MQKESTIISLLQRGTNSNQIRSDRLMANRSQLAKRTTLTLKLFFLLLEKNRFVF